MKKFEQYEIDHIEETITLTKKFLKAASTMGTAEYKELMKIKRENPTYKLVERTIKKAESKKTYPKLTIVKMREFIETYACKGDEAQKTSSLAELDSLVAFYEFHKSAKYGATKKWFFEKFGEKYRAYADVDTDADDEDTEATAS